MSSDLEQRESQMILSLERVRNYTEKKKLFKHVITKPISLKKKKTHKKNFKGLLKQAPLRKNENIIKLYLIPTLKILVSL